MARVLPTHHFHVTFTVPDELRPLMARNRKLLYNVLFGAASETLSRLAAQRLGVRLGFTMVLHTWDRKMMFHPHVHCIVTGGGLTLDDADWKATKTNFLLPVAVMRAVFAGVFVEQLGKLHDRGRLDLGGRCQRLQEPEVFLRLVRRLKRRKWVIDARPPVAGPKQVHRYLSQYTHRVAISDYRLLSVTDEQVRFRTRGQGVEEVTPEQFLRRFLLHVLDAGFHKIRHCGLYASANVHTRLAIAAKLLGHPPQPAVNDVGELREQVLTRLLGRSPRACPNCGAQAMVSIRLAPVVAPAGPTPSCRATLLRLDSS